MPPRSKAERKILYQTHEGPQDIFMQSTAEEVLYGGSAGGGKSYALRAWAVNYCMTYPGARVVLFRQSYRQLEETHIIEIQKEVPEAVAKYMASSHDLRFTNGSILHLRHCEKDEDARTYDTAEFDAILFDELTHFTEFQYNYLLSRCRSTKDWWSGRRIRSGATPLARGHAWVKSRFVDPAGKLPEYGVWKGDASEGGLTRQFIPARAIDNPTLMKYNPEYMNQLRALPDEEYRAKALGDWNVFTGQFFRRWRDNLHTVEPFDIPPDWSKYIFVDYGFNAPYAALWAARVPGSDTLYIYREQYGSGVTLEEQVQAAYESTANGEEKIKAVVLDPAMFGKVNVKGDRTDSMAESWKKKFYNICSVIPGNNDRIPGWSLMRTMIDWAEDPNGDVISQPRLKVFRTCKNTIRTLPLLKCDEHRPEDIDTDGEDHSADAIRYGIRHVFQGNIMVRPTRLRITPEGLVPGDHRSRARETSFEDLLKTRA